MKPRNREVTIFNLSMMDVISGAMGAFLILVVILSRHYQSGPVTTEAILNLQRELVEATGHIDEASREIHAGSRETKDIEGFLRKAKDNVNAGKAYIAQLKNELDAADARIRRLEEQAKALQQRIDDLEDDLARRQPYFVKAQWTCDDWGNVDIYLRGSIRTTHGEHMPEYIPRADKGTFFSEELYSNARGRSGAEVWLYEVSSIGNRIKVYSELAGEERPNCSVTGYVYSRHFDRIELPEVKLDATDSWAYVGTLVVKSDRSVVFEEATAAERAQEQAAVAERTRGK